MCQSLFLIKLSFLINFIKKEPLTQVFSCEFCEISQNTFSYRLPPVAASEIRRELVAQNIYVLQGGNFASGESLYLQGEQTKKVKDMATKWTAKYIYVKKLYADINVFPKIYFNFIKTVSDTALK